MPVQKSAGAVIFRREPRSRINSLRGREGKIYYLLLNYAAIGKVKKTYWGFSKGHIEKGEKEIDTIIREIREETGIKDLKFIKGFRQTEKYFFRFKKKNLFKIVSYSLAETKTKKIKVSFEHLGYEWLPYEEAIEKLTFRNAKEILKKANDFLSEKSL
jgi:8-oxo-dGTP pyrophosphatase MutT (NUDIX family)